MLEALESSQVFMMKRTKMMIVRMTSDNDGDDDCTGESGRGSNQPQRHHNGRCLPQDWRDD